jgi:hypothetical protein
VDVLELAEYLGALRSDHLFDLGVTLLPGGGSLDAGGHLELARINAGAQLGASLFLPFGDLGAGTYHIEPSPTQKTQGTTNERTESDEDIGNRALVPIQTHR